MDSELMLWKNEMEQNILATMKGITGISNVIRDMTDRIKKVENSLSRRVYISSVHANLLKKAVNKRVKYLTDFYGVDYRENSKKLYSGLYRALHDKYSIADYREIPDVEFDNALEFIKYWDDQLLVKRLENAS